MSFETGDVHMGGMILWWFVAISIVGLVIVLGVKRDGGRSEPPDKSAEDILRQRFAAGEIDKVDYEERLNELRK
jgi:uncharacterized membrane protein